eukprot:m.44464 g.44464  ORF g.44464 m.44464 type:complete len:774 (-) comp19685_c0_seq1:28-2349(-)
MASSGVTGVAGLIPVINKLQDVFNTVGFHKAIDLPQIVVVGSQSSGKSSVLEGIVGKDFLPRGTGIVTRVPLVMQLIHVAKENEKVTLGRGSQHRAKGPKGHNEWARFLHSDKIFTDFEEVKEEITAQTNRLVGDQKNVADKPINLKIYSPNVLDLTLVDLPGITRVAIADQPKDIEGQIRQLVYRYIQNSKSIILAVSPANSDIATSDSLQIAKDVDPTASRTIGVVTKLDLMDHGTDAKELLSGRVVPLQLGMVGVVNRSQRDINQKKSIESAIQTEEDFFAMNYATLNHQCGTPYLAKTLSRILMHHIRDSLPELKSRIEEMKSSTQRQLDALGKPVNKDVVDNGATILRYLTKFSQAFSNTLQGRSSGSISRDLVGGAKICHIFHNTFAHDLQNIEPLHGLTMDDILSTIRNATGTRPTLFVPESSFELLVKTQIKKLQQPALRCVELVHHELERVMAKCTTQELSQFRILRDKVLSVSERLVKERLPATIKMVESHIAIELAYINTNHPKFEGGSGAMMKMLTRLNAEMQRNENESTLDDIAETPHTEMKKQHAGRTPAHHSGVPSTPSLIDGDNNPLRGLSGADVKRSSSLPNTQTPDRPAQRGGLFASLWGTGGTHQNYTRPDQIMPNTPAPQTPGVMTTPSTGDFAYNQPGPSVCVGSPMPIPYPSGLSNKEKMEVEIVRSLVESYFLIVRDKILDSVPKTIMHFLVNDVEERLQNELLSVLWKGDLFDQLLEEDPQIADQRERTSEMLAALERAQELVAEVSVL